MSIERVLILNIDIPVPVYHRFGDAVWSTGKERTIWFTGCGREVPVYYQAYLRRVHADGFAVPCLRCYPEEL